MTRLMSSQTAEPEVAWGSRCTNIVGEFNEMPGMRLTLPQAARLWSLALDDCARLLDDLVQAGFLVVDDHARYARRAGRVSH